MNTFGHSPFKPELKALKREETLAKQRALTNKLRADARAVNHTQPRKHLPDTEENIANRVRQLAWVEANKDKVKAKRQKYHAKTLEESRSRIAAAIAQEEATRRRVEQMQDEE